MAKAITQIEKNQKNIQEERAEDLAAIVDQIADNREVIQDTLIILQELHNTGVLDMLKGLLRTREKVGAIAIEQLNQPAMHNMIKNGMNTIGLLSEMDPDQLQAIFGGLNQGLEKAAESTKKQEEMGIWGLMKSMRDPNVRTSMNTMVNFLNGMGSGLKSSETH
ncbi:Uncharacterized conserved protein YjgD, DUF1641 family [Salinibacillus kushneri]|uniref:Uncharacterized conserved protein YjgD, DUF1641 family n=1 Tax=Salinibacillus kushneri TaxID=237682 RepID=A0A1I0DXW5_9BACI|nr:DUF1641 domain-containing protein [Salinibacillus kushneri]SET37374.1 Uncharacterized conserved protein YjgD, DUF1641 family [Salinibacillus kushneri]